MSESWPITVLIIKFLFIKMYPEVFCRALILPLLS